MTPKLTYAQISPTLSFWLDVIRGVSAIIVLLGHARERLFGSYAADVSGMPQVLVKIFYVLFGMGTQAVMCFFLISGLLIAPKFLQGRVIDGEKLADYFIARVVRLWVVAVPALLISMLVAYGSIYFLGGFQTVLSPQCEPTAAQLATNLAFLSKAYFPVMCSNAPYWSIHNEAFYYLLFPLAVIGFGFRRSKWALAALVSFIAICATLMVSDPLDYHNTLLLFPIWILGGVTLALPKPRGGPWFWGTATIVAIILPNLLSFKSTWLIEAYMIGLTLAMFLRTITDTTLEPPIWLSRIVKWFADISFSLYLSHIFLINLIREYAVREHEVRFPFRVFDASSIGLYGFTIIACLIWAQAFYWLFERNTPKVRTFIRSAFRPSQQSSLAK